MNISEKKQNKPKTALKEIFPSYITAFALCFMLFVYEPLLMYCTHQLDFWFDIPLMVLPMLLGFFLFFLGISAVLTALYFVLKALAKERSAFIFQIIDITFFGIFFVTFLQGNILSMNLPALDGSEIDWKGLYSSDIITLAAILITAGLLVFLTVKKGIQSVLKYIKPAAIGICVFLTLFLIAEMIGWNAYKRKDSIIATDKNFSTLSEDKNFVILLCDAVGSSEFKKVLEENPEYKDVFEDFTYCPDTLSGYPCTRDNIPLILGGQFNKNEKTFHVFSSETLNGSPFFKELNDSGYDINLYESELIWYGNRNYEIKNGEVFKDYKLPFGLFMSEELKYVSYKYLPYLLKERSQIEDMNFNGLVDMYLWDDHTIYKNIKNRSELTKVPQKVFSYIHTEGAHLPFGYDKDLNIIENGTYQQKIEAVVTMLNAYIERLKANNVYDNTVIIIMADHGNTALIGADDMLARANPMFMIKGINEHHDFTESQKPVSYADLMDIYSNLLDGQTAEEALSYIPDNRQRIYMWYRNFQLENHIVEYAVTGKAWEWEDFEKTGNVYDLY